MTLEYVRYKIIDWLQILAIRLEWESLENYVWWLKWQHTLKYYGEQDWSNRGIIDNPVLELINLYYYRKSKILFKILIGE